VLVFRGFVGWGVTYQKSAEHVGKCVAGVEP
jgi:hypothetical protein